MAYVPGFVNDVFISYSHGDDETVSPKDTGWISYFDRRIGIRLRQLLGVNPSIWRDQRKLGGESIFSTEIGEQVSKTAVLIPVVSPLYLHSSYCELERRRFQVSAGETAGIRVGNKLRIFKVVKTPSEEEEHRKFLSEALGFEFFEQKDQELFSEFAIGSAQFESTLDSLAQKLAALLRAMRRQRESIYLAEPSSDLEPERERIRRELEAQGYRVLPERSLDGGDIERMISAELESGLLSVHLIGHRYQQLVVSQAELALNIGKPMIVWLARTESQETDDAQIAFIDRLARYEDPKKRFTFLKHVTLNSLSDIILEKLKPLPKEQSSQGPNGKTCIYLICDREDQRQKEQAWRLRNEILSRERFEVYWPETGLGDPRDLRQEHERKLTVCDGVLLYWGAAREKWFRENLRDLDRAPGRLRTKPFRSEAIYLTGPDMPEKKDVSEGLVIKQFDSFQFEALEPFLAPLRQRTASMA